MTASRRTPPGGQLRYDDWGARHPAWSGVRSEVVRVAATEVHLLRAGDDRDGTPHLLVHGLGGSAINWIEVMPGLARHGPVVACDLPGFGWTAPPHVRAAHIRNAARFLAALVRTLGWRELVVHGNSMGATVAVLFAGGGQHAIERLVLAAPGLPASLKATPRIDRETLRRFAPFVVPFVGSRMLARTLDTVPLDEIWRQGMAFIHADPSRVRDELAATAREIFVAGAQLPWRMPSYTTAAASLVAALVGRRELRRALDVIDAPTLVVWGSADRLVNRAMIDHTRRRRPDWPLAVLDDVGHIPMMESPAMYLDAVERWFNARGPSTPPVVHLD